MRVHHHGLKRLGVVLACAVMLAAGCASFGLVQPKSFDQRLAYTQSAITAARETATALLKRQRITPAQARQLNADADEATATVAAAQALWRDGDTQTAEAKAALARDILLRLEQTVAAWKARKEAKP